MNRRRITLGGFVGSGLPTGAAAGVAAVVLVGTALAQQITSSTEPLLEATHLPALLTVPSEPIELRYDVYCSSGDEEETGACDASGTVFARSGDSGLFREISLQEVPGGTSGLVAQVPDEIADSRSGFSYYAVLHSNASGRALTLPAGGAASPQQSLPLARGTAIGLGAHTFGRGRVADARVVDASWGSGPGQAGLEQGRNLAPIGGSAFDVQEDGTVSVLDEANRRLVRWSAGASAPEHVPLAINGALADLSVAEDGTISVLETTGGQGESQVLRSFGRNGDARGSIEIAEQAAVVRQGPHGPVVLQQPSGQWVSAAIDGRALTVGEQRRSGRAGRSLRAGSEVVLLRSGNEIRVALVGRNGVRRTWRVTSDTPLAEVQFAEPLGNRLLLVVRAYTDTNDEFVVLILDNDGIAKRFSLESADWAETAPLTRFRLAGSSLYQLGSTPRGLFVDRFDLEVK